MHTAYAHIESTPGICGGRPRIAGHRIRVQDIAIWHDRSGMSADEIVGRYPQLTLAEVHSALSYYFDHRAQIEQEIADDRDFAEQLKAATPSKLAVKRIVR